MGQAPQASKTCSLRAFRTRSADVPADAGGCVSRACCRLRLRECLRCAAGTAGRVCPPAGGPQQHSGSDAWAEQRPRGAAGTTAPAGHAGLGGLSGAQLRAPADARAQQVQGGVDPPAAPRWIPVQGVDQHAVHTCAHRDRVSCPASTRQHACPRAASSGMARVQTLQRQRSPAGQHAPEQLWPAQAHPWARKDGCRADQGRGCAQRLTWAQAEVQLGCACPPPAGPAFSTRAAPSTGSQSESRLLGRRAPPPGPHGGGPSSRTAAWLASGAACALRCRVGRRRGPGPGSMSLRCRSTADPAGCSCCCRVAARGPIRWAGTNGLVPTCERAAESAECRAQKALCKRRHGRPHHGFARGRRAAAAAARGQLARHRQADLPGQEGAGGGLPGGRGCPAGQALHRAAGRGRRQRVRLPRGQGAPWDPLGLGCPPPGPPDHARGVSAPYSRRVAPTGLPGRAPVPAAAPAAG